MLPGFTAASSLYRSSHVYRLVSAELAPAGDSEGWISTARVPPPPPSGIGGTGLPSGGCPSGTVARTVCNFEGRCGIECVPRIPSGGIGPTPKCRPPCGVGQGCCAFYDGLSYNPSCVDILPGGELAGKPNDPWNCGYCDHSCNFGAFSSGLCCNGVCYDGSNDSNNCGACSNACASGQICCGGVCCSQASCCSGVCCGQGQNCCGGNCVNLETDINNCGHCGNGCLTGTCCSGSCFPASQPCQGSSQFCLSPQVCCGGNCLNLPGPNSQTGGSNYLFLNGLAPSAGGKCQSIQGLTVTLQAGPEGLVSSKGFSLQLNAFPTALTPVAPNPCTAQFCCPAPTGVCWMQYVIQVMGTGASAFLQYWDNSGVNEQGEPLIAQLPVSDALPAGWALQIALGNDNNGNVNSILLSVLNDQGQTVGSQPMPLPEVASTNVPILTPILAFTANVVGLPGCNTASFTSGSGCLTYEVSNGQLCSYPPTSGQLNFNNCVNISENPGICENSNIAYGTLNTCCGSTLSQSIGVASS